MPNVIHDYFVHKESEMLPDEEKMPNLITTQEELDDMKVLLDRAIALNGMVPHKGVLLRNILDSQSRAIATIEAWRIVGEKVLLFLDERTALHKELRALLGLEGENRG